MSNLVLINGDKVNFIPIFGQAIVVVKPGKIEGTGKATLKGKKVCVAGDEKKVEVPGCMYMAPPYIIPGNGTLKIKSLAVNQKTKKAKDSGKPLLLKGIIFNAVFEVKSQAKQPPPGPGSPIPDPTPQYSGFGMFSTTNTKWKAG